MFPKKTPKQSPHILVTCTFHYYSEVDLVHVTEQSKLTVSDLLHKLYQQCEGCLLEVRQPGPSVVQYTCGGFPAVWCSTA